jgi:hypothetical protein
MNNVFFNKIDLFLTKQPLQKNLVRFSIQPYLMPKPVIEPLLALNATKRKPQPSKISEHIKYEVQ